ncbi:condensation domain-containing protein [Paenibacillus massiliensis]|uniref:condensation domain-containing protein n=1 Tax=Paenibacillus massiliensis TaxID=225917 RepID=UPI0004720B50|nr:condensation domain-containing protein [Paenibacillus massiliensis]
MEEALRIDSRDVEDLLSLSPVQRGMLYYAIAQPDSYAYCAQLALSLKGDIRPELFRQAISAMAYRHDMLRTVFRWQGLSSPVQIVLRGKEPTFSYSTSAGTDEVTLDVLKREELSGIQLAVSPVRFLLSARAKNEHMLVISWHHILYDGWSNALLLEELLNSYEQICNGDGVETAVASSYKSYIEWCSSQDTVEHVSYWSSYLQGFAKPTPLPASNRLRSGQARARSYSFSLSRQLQEALQSLLIMEQTTLAVLAYSAWAVLLYKYTGHEDLVFGATSSGRDMNLPRIEQLVGLCIHTLPLRVQLDQESTLRDIVEQVTTNWRSCLRYEAADPMKIRQASELNDEASLFNSVVVVENYPLPADRWKQGAAGDKDRLIIKDYEMQENTEFALVLGVMPLFHNLFTLQYDEGLYDEEVIARLGRHFELILNAMVSRMNQCLSTIEWASELVHAQEGLERMGLEKKLEFDFEL